MKRLLRCALCSTRVTGLLFTGEFTAQADVLQLSGGLDGRVSGDMLQSKAAMS